MLVLLLLQLLNKANGNITPNPSNNNAPTNVA